MVVDTAMAERGYLEEERKQGPRFRLHGQLQMIPQGYAVVVVAAVVVVVVA